MEGNQKDLISEMAEFCRLVSKSSLARFEEFKEILELRFHIPEFDILRDEIGRCFVVSAYQACITLTNHLLERYCKVFLIHKESGFTTLEKLEGLEKVFEEGNRKYMGADLDTTLKQFKAIGLLTKEEWKRFDIYRNKIRNGFGHADVNKILGDASGKFALGRFNEPAKTETAELTFAKIPILQGIALEVFAEANALPYYVEVENLMRRTIKHIQPDEFKIDHPLIVG